MRLVNLLILMKTTIKDKTKWMECCGIAGMTSTEWVRQILGYERETETRHGEVMGNLRIGGWSHAYHYAGNHGVENTQHAYERLSEEVQKLAAELDKRLHDLTAVENELRQMVREDCPNCPNQGWYMVEDSKGDPTPEQCQWCHTVEDSKFNLANAERINPHPNDDQ